MKNQIVQLFTIFITNLAMIGLTHAGTTVPSVYSTGINDFYNPLTGDSIDFHYRLISSPPGSGFDQATYLVNTNAPSASSWVKNSPNGQWIGPANDISKMTTLKATGQYIYETKFNLDRFEAATAEINGLWAVDDTSDGILLNDVPIGFARNGVTEFSSLQPFSITSGFLPGINSLKFIVNNLPVTDAVNPTGLLVIMTSTATPLPIVPEPSAYVSILAGLFILIAIRHRLS
ncbi:MAG: hypothetical protein ACKO5E_12080 [bacterium]